MCSASDDPPPTPLEATPIDTKIIEVDGVRVAETRRLSICDVTEAEEPALHKLAGRYHYAGGFPHNCYDCHALSQPTRIIEGKERREMTTTKSTTYGLRQIELADLMALDLRREAAALHGCADLDDRECVADTLDGVSTAKPFFPHPALAYRLVTGGPASDVLVAVDAGRIGIASNGDAVWGDLAGPLDITTVDGGDAYAAAIEAAIRDYLDDADAWEARA